MEISKNCLNKIELILFVYDEIRKKNHKETELKLNYSEKEDIEIEYFINKHEKLPKLSKKIIISPYLLNSSKNIFFFSENGHNFIKTITKFEYFFLKNKIKIYFSKKRNSSFLTKIFCLFKITFKNSIFYFIICNNFLPINNQLKIYDLKGSFRKSTNFKIFRDFEWKFNQESLNLKGMNKIKKIIENDVLFLKDNNVMDYSLLIGILPKKSNKNDSNKENIKNDDLLFYLINLQSNTKISISLNYKPNYYKCNKNFYFFGIIDILTEFTNKKKIEFFINSIFCKENFSCVDPKFYSRRFMEMVNEVFFDNKKI